MDEINRRLALVFLKELGLPTVDTIRYELHEDSSNRLTLNADQQQQSKSGENSPNQSGSNDEKQLGNDGEHSDGSNTAEEHQQ